MSITKGRTRNINDETSDSGAITLNATTAIKVADANADRLTFTFSNPSSKQVWLKFQAASIDNNKTGIVVFARTVYEMPVDNTYIGEISAISESGSPDVYVIEY